MNVFEEIIRPALEKAGWEESGGGNSQVYFSREGRDIYVFPGAEGSGPDDSHWVEDTDAGHLRGGWFFAADGARYSVDNVVLP